MFFIRIFLTFLWKKSFIPVWHKYPHTHTRIWYKKGQMKPYCVCVGVALWCHREKCLWFKTMTFFQVNWKPTQHVPAVFWLPPTSCPVPPGLFVEINSERLLCAMLQLKDPEWRLFSGVPEGGQQGFSHFSSLERLRFDLDFPKFLIRSLHISPHAFFECPSGLGTSKYTNGSFIMDNYCIFHNCCLLCGSLKRNSPLLHTESMMTSGVSIISRELRQWKKLMCCIFMFTIKHRLKEHLFVEKLFQSPNLINQQSVHHDAHSSVFNVKLKWKICPYLTIYAKNVTKETISL